ncbi:terminase gpA endonuclease subunit [Helicobacter sp. 11S02629-2]|uniref:phage terminase large subunit family protein n=1 Tax=Helicobacter sp. 11S02629-2 TaxID=1476195 RepID=UPI000BA63BEE|nr:terminase gpA endonuclease subunit [Helicobacter sp. 11S02629-2]PAF41390.1 terminase [Helicobacter sp. 11S02629-2]
MSARDYLIKCFCEGFKLKPRYNLLEWSESFRILSREASSNFGKFKAHAYQKEPLLAISNPKIEKVVLMWSSQLGKSEILNNVIGYYIHQDPSPIMFVLPTEDMAEDYSKRRLTPMFRDTKLIGDLINARESNNTILIKNFKGGNLALVGSNTPSKLSSKPIKVLLADELDRCENTKEGFSIDLAEKRTVTFFDRKVVVASTPTIAGRSRIEKEFIDSDMRYFYINCPNCSTEQILEFSQVYWDKDEDGAPLFDTVHYRCKACEKHLNEKEKNTCVANGIWKSKNPTSTKVGFYLNALYSPYYSMKDIVKSFYESHKDSTKLQVFKNTILCETFEPPSIKLEEAEYFNRREDYEFNSLPDEILFLTAGVDVQGGSKARLELEIKGYGKGLENWGVLYTQLWGDPKEDKVWEELYKLLKTSFTTKSGRKLTLSITLIDSGYAQERCLLFARLDSRFLITKGASEATSKREFVKFPPTKINGIYHFTLGTYEGKNILFDMLQVQESGAGYCHYPLTYEMEYFKQLTAERVQKIENARGYTALRWTKTRERNEALDLSVLCLAGAKILIRGKEKAYF